MAHCLREKLKVASTTYLLVCSIIITSPAFCADRLADARTSIANVFQCKWGEGADKGICARANESPITWTEDASGATVEYFFVNEKSPEPNSGQKRTRDVIEKLAPGWKDGTAWLAMELPKNNYAYAASMTGPGIRIDLNTGTDKNGLATKVVVITVTRDAAARITKDEPSGAQPFGHPLQNIKAAIQSIVGCEVWENSYQTNAISCAMRNTPFEVSLSSDADGNVRLFEMLVPIDDFPEFSNPLPIADIQSRLIRVMRYLDKTWDEEWIAQSLKNSADEEFRAMEEVHNQIAIIQPMDGFNQVDADHLASIVLLDRKFLEGEGKLNRSRNLADYFYAREARIAERMFHLPATSSAYLPEYAFTPVCLQYRDLDKGTPGCR